MVLSIFSKRSTRGTTMAELMVSIGIFLIAVLGILYSYVKCMELQDLGRTTSLTTQAAHNKMEQIKNSNFSTLFTVFNGTTFQTTGVNGIGVIYVNNTLPNMTQIKIAFCWKQPNGRLIGEDANLNGVLNAGEDKNGNGEIDSYVQLTTNIYN